MQCALPDLTAFIHDGYGQMPPFPPSAFQLSSAHIHTAKICNSDYTGSPLLWYNSYMIVGLSKNGYPKPTQTPLTLYM